MVKKTFSLIIIILFSASFMSTSSHLMEIEDTNCFELADIGTNNANCDYEQAFGHQMSHQQQYDFWGNLFLQCSALQGNTFDSMNGVNISQQQSL